MAAALEHVGDTVEDVLVIGADTILVHLDSIDALLATRAETAASMAVLTAPNFGDSDLGRVVVSKGGRITRIVEAGRGRRQPRILRRPAERGRLLLPLRLAPAQRAQTPAPCLRGAVPHRPGPNRLPGAGPVFVPFRSSALEEVLGINDRTQLANAEAMMQDRIRTRWLIEGVTMTDPDSVYIDADATIGMDTVILPNTNDCGPDYHRRELRDRPQLGDPRQRHRQQLPRYVVGPRGSDYGGRYRRRPLQPPAPRRVPGIRSTHRQLRGGQGKPVQGRRSDGTLRLRWRRHHRRPRQRRRGA